VIDGATSSLFLSTQILLSCLFVANITAITLLTSFYKHIDEYSEYLTKHNDGLKTGFTNKDALRSDSFSELILIEKRSKYSLLAAIIFGISEVCVILAHICTRLIPSEGNVSSLTHGLIDIAISMFFIGIVTLFLIYRKKIQHINQIKKNDIRNDVK
jgi:hypothetical protein